jgi:hypothetical protein
MIKMRNHYEKLRIKANNENEKLIETEISINSPCGFQRREEVCVCVNRHIGPGESIKTNIFAIKTHNACKLLCDSFIGGQVRRYYICLAPFLSERVQRCDVFMSNKLYSETSHFASPGGEPCLAL